MSAYDAYFGNRLKAYELPEAEVADARNKIKDFPSP